MVRVVPVEQGAVPPRAWGAYATFALSCGAGSRLASATAGGGAAGAGVGGGATRATTFGFMAERMFSGPESGGGVACRSSLAAEGAAASAAMSAVDAGGGGGGSGAGAAAGAGAGAVSVGALLAVWICGTLEGCCIRRQPNPAATTTIAALATATGQRGTERRALPRTASAAARLIVRSSSGDGSLCGRLR